MPDMIAVNVNGAKREVASGTSALAAAMMNGAKFVRRSVTGEPRGPLCGMGICFECRMTINGLRHCRSCQIVCEQGMDIRTDE
ncbi:MAG TPA: (2Fe-2S)-binding protein [Candidatus Acidoferrales bacterium]|nr:(2Fe-2S)-binding protein [Candidatus Acidoferrales bacterium]